MKSLLGLFFLLASSQVSSLNDDICPLFEASNIPASSLEDCLQAAGGDMEEIKKKVCQGLARVEPRQSQTVGCP